MKSDAYSDRHRVISGRQKKDGVLGCNRKEGVHTARAQHDPTRALPGGVHAAILV